EVNKGTIGFCMNNSLNGEVSVIATKLACEQLSLKTNPSITSANIFLASLICSSVITDGTVGTSILSFILGSRKTPLSSWNPGLEIIFPSANINGTSTRLLIIGTLHSQDGSVTIREASVGT